MIDFSCSIHKENYIVICKECRDLSTYRYAILPDTEKKKKRKMKLIVITTLLITIGVFVSIFFIVSKQNPNDDCAGTGGCKMYLRLSQ